MEMIFSLCMLGNFFFFVLFFFSITFFLPKISFQESRLSISLGCFILYFFNLFRKRITYFSYY